MLALYGIGKKRCMREQSLEPQRDPKDLAWLLQEQLHKSWKAPDLIARFNEREKDRVQKTIERMSIPSSGTRGRQIFTCGIAPVFRSPHTRAKARAPVKFEGPSMLPSYKSEEKACMGGRRPEPP